MSYGQKSFKVGDIWRGFAIVSFGFHYIGRMSEILMNGKSVRQRILPSSHC